MKIRPIVVEFLRAGPRHNQLLSPLTPYLTVCGDSPAGQVHLPYEQAAFERRREELRYTVTAEGDEGRLRGVLDQTGREMAEILANVPGLPGALMGRRETDEILQLRIVLSASELALLPFELSKVPTGGGVVSDSWLLLQAHAPVCITRHSRSIKSEGVKWPRRPRILFVSGEDVPDEEHLQALHRALNPWARDEASRRSWLTVLKNASLKEVMDEARKADYTHVHILAHGAQYAETKRDAYGVSLKGSVVSGGELATALLSVTPNRIHRPTVVTLATCDSGGGGSLIHAPDVSVAHDLHEAGIPLVVASQFPLSASGSVPFVETFYSDQLWGVHPLISLYRVRLLLHASHSRHYHDWASLVVYEALPENLSDQLHDVRYNQTRSVLEGALKSIEEATRKAERRPTQEKYRELIDRVCLAREELPNSGPYASECLGLRAASWKRLAEVEYHLARGDSEAPGHVSECYLDLETALADYRRAARAFLVNTEEPVRRKATLHWLLGQVISVECALGWPFRKDYWMTALLSASEELEQPTADSVVWGYGTLAELHLLRLADDGIPEAESAEAVGKVLGYAQQLVAANGLMSEPVSSTRRQFERYINWWSQPEFARMTEAYGVPDKGHWHRPGGLVQTARRAVAIMGGRRETSARQPQADKPVAEEPAEPPPPPPAPKAPTHRASERAVLGDRPTTSGSSGALAIELLPAENGDCLWIEYGDTASPRRLLVDCGARSAARLLTARIEALDPAQRQMELFVLTHIDSDHIIGVLPFFEKLPTGLSFSQIWFNGWNQLPKDRLGVKQGEEFSTLLSAPEFKERWNLGFSTGASPFPDPIVVPEQGSLPTVTLADGMRITLLSPGVTQLSDLARNWLKGLLELHPDKKVQDLLARKAPPPKVTDFEHFDVKALADRKTPPDKSVANGSSLAMLLEFDGKSALLAGDAHAEVVAASVRRLLSERNAPPGSKLHVDALKLSHHGSCNACTKELLDVLECQKYLVSTDGSKFYHPDREALARVVQYGGPGPAIYFNYVSEMNDLWGNPVLRERYNYRAEYPTKEQPGIRVSL